MKDQQIIAPFAHGFALGGYTALAEALRLWAQCAEGSADSSMLPFNDAAAFVRLRAAKAGFAAAIEALTSNWEDERVDSFQTTWREGARSALLRAAGHLLAACKEVERGNRADAGYTVENDGDVVFHWSGHWTNGRFIAVRVGFGSTVRSPLKVTMEWDTATGKESTYLSLPSMTDEADRPDAERREGGWMMRGVDERRG